MMDKRDAEFMGQAKRAALNSKDPSTKVGAVVVLEGVHKARACFNHFPEGFDPEAATREERYAAVVHAEAHALGGLYWIGATLYSTHEPCAACWEKIEQAGVDRVVFQSTSQERRERWGCDCAARTRFLSRGGIMEIVGTTETAGG